MKTDHATDLARADTIVIPVRQNAGEIRLADGRALIHLSWLYVGGPEMLRELERRAGPFAAIAVTGIVAAGTYAQFALPYHRGGAEPVGCYFYDALFIGVRCAPDMPGMLAGGLTISWYLTWGVYWLALAAVMPPFLGVPVLGLWGLVIRSGARWIWSKRSQPALHP